MQGRTMTVVAVAETDLRAEMRELRVTRRDLALELGLRISAVGDVIRYGTPPAEWLDVARRIAARLVEAA